MTKEQIIAEMAAEKKVERLAGIITRETGAKIDDLCQAVYEILLKQPAELIERLYASQELDFWTIRVIRNTRYRPNSEYYRTFERYASLATDIDTYAAQATC